MYCDTLMRATTVEVLYSVCVVLCLFYSFTVRYENEY